MKPTRVILASNTNPEYIQFWPLVARHWQAIHHLRPTLFFIGPKDRPLETDIGDVIFVDPLPGIPTSFQAQMIRLFAPTLFPEDCCVICDIDLLLLEPDFFRHYGVDQLPDTDWVSLNRYGMAFQHVSLSYQVAKGQTFRNVFGCDGQNLESIRNHIQKYAGKDLKWATDELVLAAALRRWNGGTWHKIHTPGIWGGKQAIYSVTRFHNCSFQPAQAAKLLELEPFRPLLRTVPLVRRILSLRNPEFRFPELTDIYEGDPQTEASRHPFDRKKVTRVSSRP